MTILDYIAEGIHRLTPHEQQQVAALVCRFDKAAPAECVAQLEGAIWPTPTAQEQVAAAAARYRNDKDAPRKRAEAFRATFGVLSEEDGLIFEQVLRDSRRM